MKRIPVILAALLIAGLLVGVVSAASVGWSAAPKWQLGTMKPNRFYDVGQGYAYNPGEAAQCYIMEVGNFSDPTLKRTAPEWVIFSPASFCLEPGAGVLVDIGLYVQPKFKIEGELKGNYHAFVGPCTYEPTSWGQIGACVASRLYFSIGNGE